MNHELIKQFVRFKILMTKEGQKVDLVQFQNDENYAKVMLGLALTTENEDLLFVAMHINETRFPATIIKAKTSVATKPTDDGDPPATPKGNKYVGKLR